MATSQKIYDQAFTFFKQAGERETPQELASLKKAYELLITIPKGDPFYDRATFDAKRINNILRGKKGLGTQPVKRPASLLKERAKILEAEKPDRLKTELIRKGRELILDELIEKGIREVPPLKEPGIIEKAKSKIAKTGGKAKAAGTQIISGLTKVLNQLIGE